MANRRLIPPYPAESCLWHLVGGFLTSLAIPLAVAIDRAESLKDFFDSLGIVALSWLYPIGPFGVLLWVFVVHPVLWLLWTAARRLAND
ncbi:MAG: hypothetical protein HYV19_03390 [Gemmatimonadetes bacterium]|nr:hypothetical protein [Gemmatimonadota bacterium]